MEGRRRAQQGVVIVMMSNCPTWVESLSIDERTRNVVACEDIFHSLGARVWLACSEGSERREKVYEFEHNTSY